MRPDRGGHAAGVRVWGSLAKSQAGPSERHRKGRRTHGYHRTRLTRRILGWSAHQSRAEISRTIAEHEAMAQTPVASSSRI
jgi:hypothetical protein